MDKATVCHLQYSIKRKWKVISSRAVCSERSGLFPRRTAPELLQEKLLSVIRLVTPCHCSLNLPLSGTFCWRLLHFPVFSHFFTVCISCFIFSFCHDLSSIFTVCLPPLISFEWSYINLLLGNMFRMALKVKGITFSLAFLFFLTFKTF